MPSSLEIPISGKVSHTSIFRYFFHRWHASSTNALYTYRGRYVPKVRKNSKKVTKKLWAPVILQSESGRTKRQPPFIGHHEFNPFFQFLSPPEKESFPSRCSRAHVRAPSLGFWTKNLHNLHITAPKPRILDFATLPSFSSLFCPKKATKRLLSSNSVKKCPKYRHNHLVIKTIQRFLWRLWKQKVRNCCSARVRARVRERFSQIVRLCLLLPFLALLQNVGDFWNFVGDYL